VAVWLAIEGQFRDIARRYANVTPSEPRPEPPPAEAAQEAEYNAEKECLVASAFADDE
jgi:hypothetical protein